MMQRLAARLEKNPTDGEGFRMLAWSYVMTSHPDKAIPAYKRALALLPNQSNVHAGYGEALVGVAKGTVTPEAKAAFDRAIQIDPSEPRARYFEALWLAQHGQEKEALEKWIALANGGPADAPWQTDLRRQIGETSAKLGGDVSSRLAKAAPIGVGRIGVGPVSAGVAPPIPNEAMQAASALPAADRQAMVDEMVEGLARKLAANPKDADGWIRLLRSRMVLKQDQQAARDLATARRSLASSPADLARVVASAKENGVPGS
jgi:cytochrome c-type biogenesis protein CcmH